MSTDTTGNAVTADTSLIDSFSRAVAGRAELVTDEAVLIERGHDFWGFGGTAGLLLRPAGRDEIASPSRSTDPRFGLSIRASARSAVDFPQALGPTITVNPPSGIRTSSPSDTVRPA